MAMPATTTKHESFNGKYHTRADAEKLVNDKYPDAISVTWHDQSYGFKAVVVIPARHEKN